MITTIGWIVAGIATGVAVLTAGFFIVVAVFAVRERKYQLTIYTKPADGSPLRPGNLDDVLESFRKERQK
jgi:hypothetical protein